MGCDIHMVVQCFNGTSWDPAPIHGYGARNYYLFAALAGVRNYDGVKPISEPRGLPEMAPHTPESEDEPRRTGDAFLCDRWWDGSDYDLKAAAYAEREPRWLGEHSFSHLTLAEIVSWPGWGTPVQREGIVSFDDYVKWKESGAPNPPSWCRGVGGPNISIFLSSDVPMLLGMMARFPALYSSKSYFTVAHWTDPGVDAGPDWARFVAALRQYATDTNLTYEQVRIVFGFDS